MRVGRWIVGVACVVLLGLVGWVQLRFAAGVREAERRWREDPVTPMRDLGTTASLSILPLVDWHVARPDLRGEAGVSYLVETDEHAILFDAGFHRDATDPSPLEHNMERLGVSVADFDTIVISHLHPDHVGGIGAWRRATFSLGNRSADLVGKRLFVPVLMTYPDLDPVVTRVPTAIAPGVATLGTIPRRLFLGWVEEQALAVHVENVGMVVIVGCGHQTLRKILARTRRLFAAPLAGLVGGLHYPVPEGRGRTLGIDVQRRFALGAGPWRPLRMEDVEADIARLAELAPRVVALSPHDSSDLVIERFAEAFGERYRPLRVGERIRVP